MKSSLDRRRKKPEWPAFIDISKYKSKAPQVFIIKERCKECEWCIIHCPEEILEKSEEINEKGYHPPKLIDGKTFDDCAECHFCELICPEFSIFVIVPKEKMGRVFSVLMVMAMAITPLGNFLSGVIGEYVPMGILFTLSAILGIVSFLSIYLFSPARHLDKVIEQRIVLLKKAEEESEDETTDYDFEEIKDSIELVDQIKLEESISTTETPTK